MTARLRTFAALLTASTWPLLAAMPSHAQGLADPTVAPTDAPSGTTAQQPQNVILVADSVTLQGGGILIARGNVEALSGDIRLQADQVIYDNDLGTIEISGPIRITQGDFVSIVASAAELDADLLNGLIYSARLVMSDQLQLAAQQMKRVDGRFNVLSKTIVSSCHICETGEAPLWSIRARRVVHDQEERQIYFDHASLLVKDVPVFYFPHLRMPDPTLKRTRGFLIPSLRNSSLQGYGAKIPYFLPLGETRDLTLTPYLAQKSTTLEFRYRQAFRNGGIELNGAISDDTISPERTRGYLFAEGLFALRNNYKLSFDIKAVSDESYLTDYNYANFDRLNSDITVERASRTENTRFALYSYQSLREAEDNNEIPSAVLRAQTERRYLNVGGGEIRTFVQAHGHQRRSSSDVVGRDVARATASVQWLGNWTLGNGLRAAATGAAAFDAFRTDNDSSVSSFDTGITPTVATSLRYPMAKQAANGARYVIEPVAQISWSGGNNLDVANDESTRVEFDEGNLLSLSRFPSTDRRERGLSAAVGLNWLRSSANGWQGSFTFGQIFRQNADPNFSKSSGLSAKTSDLLFAGQFLSPNGLNVTGRTLLTPTGTLDKAAARLRWQNDIVWLDASYIWLQADAQEDRLDDVSELAFDGSYRFNRHWTGLADWRFDAVSGEASQAGLGLEYRNECLKVELSVSRRFSTSINVQSNTSIGLSVAVLGFSTNSNDKSYDRTCG